jgi:hypothetical protein
MLVGDLRDLVVELTVKEPTSKCGQCFEQQQTKTKMRTRTCGDM